MPQIILQVYPTAGPLEEMARLRPIGRNADAYQSMLAGLIECSKAADDLGYWGITHVEHHGHSEGLEISPDPLMLNVYLGQYTKRLRHGQLGLVVPSHDPVRLAESIAIADHMLKGRLFVGLARGYQARWQNVVSQHFNVTSTASDQSAADQRNRLLFEEHYKIMKMAWANDVLRYKGPVYEMPYPFEEGIPNWPPAQATTLPYGAPGEVDENGTITRPSRSCRAPTRSRTPQLFQAFGASPATLRWCGEEDVTPTMLAGPIETCRSLIEVYREGAASRGREVPFGKGIGIVRTFHITENRQQIYDWTDRYEDPVWNGWYRPFGFMEAARLPGEEGPVPKPGEHLADRLMNCGIMMAGTVDDVKRQIERTLTELPVDYIVWLFHLGSLRPRPRSAAAGAVRERGDARVRHGRNPCRRRHRRRDPVEGRRTSAGRASRARALRRPRDARPLHETTTRPPKGTHGYRAGRRRPARRPAELRVHADDRPERRHASPTPRTRPFKPKINTLTHEGAGRDWMLSTFGMTAADLVWS